jgi:superfamily II DNA or RNA helicase
MELRPYQADVITAFGHEVAKGRRRIILVAPTGAGKTVIASEIIQAEISLCRRVLVLAHRREIITQTSQKLHDQGIENGIIAAGFMPRPVEVVQVASIQTLHARGIRTDAMQLPPADLLVIDEAHHCPASTYRKLSRPIRTRPCLA